MTTARHPRGSATVVRGAFGASLVVAAAALPVAALAAGQRGVLGAALGAALAVGFFGLGHVVLMRMRHVDPVMFLVVALLTYALQVLCLLVVFGSFAAWSDDVSGRSLGLTIIACTAAWTAGLVVASRRQRIPLFDLGGEAR